MDRLEARAGHVYAAVADGLTISVQPRVSLDHRWVATSNTSIQVSNTICLGAKADFLSCSIDSTSDRWNVWGGTTEEPCSRGREERATAAELMWLVVIEQRPKGHVTANQSVCLCLLMCVLSQAQAAMVRACLQSVHPYGREEETDSRPPPTDTYPTSNLSVLPSQEERKSETQGRLWCAQTLWESWDNGQKMV